jgi:enoyl-CoA hydratase/carnithine racemase
MFMAIRMHHSEPHTAEHTRQLHYNQGVVSMSEPRVQLAVENRVALLTLNRPRVRNAIDDGMRTELTQALQQIGQDDAVRAVVLTGAGQSFCSGGDIAAMQQRLSAPPGEVSGNGWRRQRRTHGLVTTLHHLDKPTIAAVNGAAAGLGCDLTLCCDFIVAAESAYFVMSFIQRALVPDGGGLYFLPRRVGVAKAKELIYSARRVPAAEALSIGLADRVVPPERLLAEALEWASALADAAPTALALSKSMLNRTFELSLEQALAMGAEAQAICYTTDEHRASVAEFLKPKA